MVDEEWKNKETGKYQCPYCDKEFSKKGISTHILRTHKGIPFNKGKICKKPEGWEPWNKGLKFSNKIEIPLTVCETCGIIPDVVFASGRFCSISCANSHKVSDNTKLKIGKANNGRVLKKFSKLTLKICYSCGKSRLTSVTDNAKTCGKECYKVLLRDKAIERGFGGVTQSRWIEYNGKTLGSSYELKVAESLDKNNIKWDTCKRFKYVDKNGKNRTYTPDLYLLDYDIYLEPKNDFLIENINPNLGFMDVEKIKWAEEQNNIKVILLNKNQLSWEYINTQLSDKRLIVELRERVIDVLINKHKPYKKEQIQEMVKEAYNMLCGLTKSKYDTRLLQAVEDEFLMNTTKNF